MEEILGKVINQYPLYPYLLYRLSIAIFIRIYKVCFFITTLDCKHQIAFAKYQIYTCFTLSTKSVH